MLNNLKINFMSSIGLIETTELDAIQEAQAELNLCFKQPGRSCKRNINYQEKEGNVSEPRTIVTRKAKSCREKKVLTPKSSVQNGTAQHKRLKKRKIGRPRKTGKKKVDGPCVPKEIEGYKNSGGQSYFLVRCVDGCSPWWIPEQTALKEIPHLVNTHYDKQRQLLGMRDANTTGRPHNMLEQNGNIRWDKIFVKDENIGSNPLSSYSFIDRMREKCAKHSIKLRYFQSNTPDPEIIDISNDLDSVDEINAFQLQKTLVNKLLEDQNFGHRRLVKVLRAGLAQKSIGMRTVADVCQIKQEVKTETEHVSAEDNDQSLTL